MEIIYQKEFDPKHETDIRYMLRVDFENKEVDWIIYQPAPKEMYFKHADMLGLGVDHHSGRQSFDEFIETPLKNVNAAQKQMSNPVHGIISFLLNSRYISLEAKELKTKFQITEFTLENGYSDLDYNIVLKNNESISISVPKTELQMRMDEWMRATHYRDEEE